MINSLEKYYVKTRFLISQLLSCEIRNLVLVQI